MSDKQCPHCAMSIPEKAKICPFCRKKLGWTTGAKLGLALILLIAFSAWFVSLNTSSDKDVKDISKPKVTEEQKKAAQEYIDLLMSSGLFKEMKGEGKLQVIYVDKSYWNITKYEQKKDILKGISRSNEVLGYSPYIEIRDQISGEVYAALKPPLTFKVYK